MDYRTRQIDFTPQREVSIFILQNKKWVDVFSGPCTFLYDFQLKEFRVVFRVSHHSQPHVYRLQPKIRRKGPKAFVIRAQGVTSDVGEAILAFRFENDTDSFNFQFFMEQRQVHEKQKKQTHNPYDQRTASQPQQHQFYSGTHTPVSNRYHPNNIHSHSRVSSSITPSYRAKKYSTGAYGGSSGIRLSSKSPSIISIPTLDGSIRSQPPQPNVVPLTQQNLQIHDARMPPRPRKVAEVLKIST